MPIVWTVATLDQLDATGIEPSLVQRALAEPDTIEPGPPIHHVLRFWDRGLNREMWLRVQVEPCPGGHAIVEAIKVPVYPE